MKFFQLALKSLIPVFFLFPFLPNRSAAQNRHLADVEKKFIEFSNSNLQEKAFLHTDKHQYLAGEVLWFKAYLVDAHTNLPAVVSKLLYIELLDGNNKPVLQTKIGLKEGAGNGSVFLPLTLITGNYTIRAYTSWMKNFHPDLYFQKKLPVVNSLKVLPEFAAQPAPAFFIRFFPEGGNLVQGINSKIAFKATNGAGNGVDIQGYLLAGERDTVLQFSSHRLGMGHFRFTPDASVRYTAVVVQPTGTFSRHELPSVFAKGYSLQLHPGEMEIMLAVAASADIDPATPVILMAHSGEKIHSIKERTLRDGRFVFPLQDLPEGITQFTLFGTAGQPLCERLFFKKPDPNAILFQNISKIYQKRERVTPDLTLPGNLGTAGLSLSVFRSDENVPEEENIQSWYWLGSQLKGYIEKPGYYFSDTASSEATDNLMLTQGWRRFSWENVLKTQKPVIRFAPEYNGHIISGMVRNQRTGMPASRVTTYLTLPGSNYKLASSVSDAAGLVYFDIKDFYGNAGLVVTKDTGLQVALLNPFSEEYAPALKEAFQLTGYNRDQLSDQSVAMQVQHWFYADSLKKFIVPEIDTVPFFGNADKTYNLDLYKRFPTMEEVFREYILEIIVRSRNGKKEIAVYDLANRQFFQSLPLVLLDGIPVFDQSRIFAYDPLKVSRVDVVTQRYYMGHSSFDGIVNFVTYTGAFEEYPLDPQSVIVDYEGMQLQREFYAPVYESETQRASRLPDQRELLYWNPDQVQQQKGRLQFSFYTSDQRGAYHMLLQGMDEKGKPVIGYQSFSVE